ncbi:hypothetical protein TIFTF001_015920 [Ficus carica]|uniref:Uncharacterized protein n=1 Tax=Ficus carica TaxID=3494 RepID=A0AA88D9F2_FICCA|nr:hypothetical protein TIFTF001_015920 [Ficus carica]
MVLFLPSLSLSPPTARLPRRHYYRHEASHRGSTILEHERGFAKGNRASSFPTSLHNVMVLIIPRRSQRVFKRNLSFLFVRYEFAT